MNKIIFSIIFLINLSCENNVPNDVGISSLLDANISGAVAISSIKKNNNDNRNISGNESLIKIDVEGRIYSALGNSNDFFPDVNFIHTTDDGSIFVNYEYKFTISEESGYSYNVQFLQIKPDNSVELIGHDLIMKPVVNQDTKTFIYFATNDSISKVSCITGDVITISEDIDIEIHSLKVNSVGEIMILGLSGDDFFSDETVIQYYAHDGIKNEIYRITPTGYNLYNPLIDRVTISTYSDKFIIQFGEQVREDLYGGGAFTIDIIDGYNYEEYISWGRYIFHYSLIYDESSESNSLYKNTAFYNNREGALIVEGDDGSYSWSENIITDGVISEIKLYNLMASYTIANFSIKESTLSYFMNLNNFENIITELSQVSSETFFNNYFNGELLKDELNNDYGLQKGVVLNGINNFFILDNSLYGISSSFCGLRVVKVLNSDNEVDIEFVDFDERKKFVGSGASYRTISDVNKNMYQLVGENLYFFYTDYQVQDGDNPNYDYGRYNVKTGFTEYFNDWSGLDIEVDNLSVTNDEHYIYLHGKKISDNSLCSIRFDLYTNEIQELDISYELGIIETL